MALFRRIPSLHSPPVAVHSDYQIEDLVFQTRELVLYRAQHHCGIPHAIIRLKFSDEVLANLQAQDRFQKGLEELQLLGHPNLRRVVDGGLDPVDGHPWIATKWVEGSTLSQVQITTDEVESLRKQAQDLIASLGYRSGALAFSADEVVVADAHHGKPRYTFAIDFFSWFRDWAIGYPPGEKNNPHHFLETLIRSLKPIEPAPPENPAAASSAPGIPKANVPTMLVTSKLPPQTYKPKQKAAPAASAPPPVTPQPGTPVALPPAGNKLLIPGLLIVSMLLLIEGGIFWINSRAPEETVTPDNVASTETPDSSSPPKPEPREENEDEEPEAPDASPTLASSPPRRIQPSGRYSPE
ncbi:MAG: hypothetical protein ACON38_20215 [Akkermansiaceae bacterium]